MTPKKLEDWTEEVVINMLEKKLFESELFDLKKKLPDSKDREGKLRLQKTCSAFANSNGGFIVFGVVDDKTKTPDDRIIGIDSSIDFPENFGNFPKNCIPSIYWDFLNPPIILKNGNYLHVVYIPKSYQSPHAVGIKDDSWVFTKRTNKGNEAMAIEEIRNSFLGYYEKKLKLELLLAELLSIKDNAESMIISTDENISEKYSLVTFETNIIASIQVDTQTILSKETELLGYLNRIRQETRMVNNKVGIFFSIVAMPLSNKNTLVREHNEYIKPRCKTIMDICDAAITILKEVVAK